MTGKDTTDTGTMCTSTRGARAGQAQQKQKLIRARLRQKMSTKKDGSLRHKRCAKCRTLAPIATFPPHPSSEDGFAAYCRNCKNELAKERRLKDPVARLKHYIVTRIKNELPKEVIPEDLQKNIEFYLGYKLRILVKNLREDLRKREQITLFQCFKAGYHLDHIKPHSSYKIRAVQSEEFLACWHFTNLRMISAQENLKKGAKYVE